MAKNNTAKQIQSPAEEGLADLIEMESTDETTENVAAPTATADALSKTTTSAAEFDSSDDDMEAVGGNGPRVEVFFSHEEYDNMKATDRVIKVGDVIDGTYLGSFTSGQYNSRKHKIRPSKGEFAGIVVGLPTCGKLDSAFQFTPEGTRTIVEYGGRATKADVGPDWKGQLPYRYEVALPKGVKAAAKLGQLPANYELKKRDK